MSDNLVLSVPKKNCTEIEVKGIPFMQIDVGMTAQQFMVKMMEYVSNGETPCAIVRKDNHDGC